MNKWIINYQALAIGVLTFTGIAKLAGGSLHNPILTLSEPVFGFVARNLTLLLGVFEIAVAMFILLYPKRLFTLTLSSFTFIAISLYRLASSRLAADSICPCLGYLDLGIEADSGLIKMLLGNASAFMALAGICLLLASTISERRI
jgi:hypothetical protein